MYIVKEKFRDLTDNHIYEKYDKFPFDDRKVSEKRIKELTSKKNKLKKTLIEFSREATILSDKNEDEELEDKLSDKNEVQGEE